MDIQAFLSGLGIFIGAILCLSFLVIVVVSVLLMLGVSVPVLGTFGLLSVFAKKTLDRESATEQSARSWPYTSGRILRSEVVIGAKGRRSPKIVYQYSVYGKEFTSDKIAAGMLVLTPGHSAEDLVRQYPAGVDVTVFYNPDNPKQSALER